GFFDYDASGKAVAQSSDTPSAAPPATRVAVAEEDEALAELLRSFGFQVSDFDDGEGPVLCAPLGEDCASFDARLGVDHTRLFALDIAGKLDRRLTVMHAPG